MSNILVHIAGKMEGGIQRCSRCGCVLIDYSNGGVMVAGQSRQLGFWATGGMIGVDGNCSFVTSEPLEFEWQECGEVRIQ